MNGRQVQAVEEARFGGVDWSWERHAVCIVDATGAVVERFEAEHQAGLLLQGSSEARGVGARVCSEHFIFATRDPYGRLVVLTRERLDHIRERHPELDDESLVPFLMEAVEVPRELHHGRSSDETWFYLDRGPSRWIKVVVRFDRHGTGRIITSFPRRSRP